MFQRNFVVPAFLFQPAECVMDERRGAKTLGWEVAVNISNTEVLNFKRVGRVCPQRAGFQPGDSSALRVKSPYLSRISGGQESNGLGVKPRPGVIVGEVQLCLRVASQFLATKMPGPPV